MQNIIEVLEANRRDALAKKADEVAQQQKDRDELWTEMQNEIVVALKRQGFSNPEDELEFHLDNYEPVTKRIGFHIVVRGYKGASAGTYYRSAELHIDNLVCELTNPFRWEPLPPPYEYLQEEYEESPKDTSIKHVMRCPVLSIGQESLEPCSEDDCALWNKLLGCCGLIAQGLIAGAEVTREEAADAY